jgi:hypothetical protein
VKKVWAVKLLANGRVHESDTSSDVSSLSSQLVGGYTADLVLMAKCIGQSEIYLHLQLSIRGIALHSFSESTEGKQIEFSANFPFLRNSKICIHPQTWPFFRVFHGDFENFAK